MTVLAFPDTTGQPTDGSFQYTANGVIYSWNGSYWAANNQQGFDQRYVEVAGDVMTGDLTVPSLNGGPLAGMRNVLINSDFRVWQRGTSINVTTGNNTYTADRWFVFSTPTAVSISRSNDAPRGASYSIVSPAAASAMVQPVEVETGKSGPFVVGSQWTLSLWSTQNLTQTTTPWRWRNDASGSSVNTDAIAGACTWTATGETDGPWARYSTTQIITAANPAGGNCLVVYLPFGAQYTAELKLALVQLEPGTVATPLEIRPIQTELALCQRYYQIGRAAWQCVGGNAFTWVSNLPSVLRTSSATVNTSSTSGRNIQQARLLQGFGRLPVTLQLTAGSGSADVQCATDFSIDAEL